MIDTETRPETSSSFTTDIHPMSSDIAISVRNVSKMYPLYRDPRDRLKQSLWYALPKFLRGKQPPEFYKEFWALRDISFDVKKGETVGIIGRNGSGKSTLLQIIAGTLAPTHGEVQVNGRVAALLELGSGFNPEFTGRENVYMNGAILGLSREEMDERFDDIAAFADIGQFMDQPVKLYSSGMVVRLAFAVQAFVPKQVLIVDEALAVGDAAFQRKCMRVLENFKDNGGTVLLVSHDAQAIVRHTDRCLLLSQGELLVEGPSKPVTDLYLKIMFSPPDKAIALVEQLRSKEPNERLSTDSEQESASGIQTEEKETIITSQLQSDERILAQDYPEPEDFFDPHIPLPQPVIYGNGQAKIFDFGLFNLKGKKVNVLVMGHVYQWRYKVHFFETVSQVGFGFLIKTIDGIELAGHNSIIEDALIESVSANSIVEVIFKFQLNIAPGTYFLNSGVTSGIGIEFLHRIVDCYTIRILPRNNQSVYGLSYIAPQLKYKNIKGDCLPL